MIELITGLPGAGKTLYTLQRVEKLRQETGRDVYYHNIKDLTLPWHRLEKGSDWVSVPDNSIVVLDECQVTFPTRPQGSSVPAHVEAASVHRHRGLDLFLVTQDPMQFDAFVRRLAGRHHHLRRAFGLGFARVWSWEGLGKPGDFFSERDAVKTRWKHPKDFFVVYKSAEVHTKTATVPWRKIGIVVGGIGLVIGLIWSVMHRMRDRTSESADVLAAGPPSFLAKPPAVASARMDWSPEAWYPRQPGVLASAAVYDPVAVVQAAPVIAGCYELRINNDVRCRCSTPHGSDAMVDTRLCRHYMKHGIFRWDVLPADARAANIEYLERTRSIGGMAFGVVSGMVPAAHAEPASASEPAGGAMGSGRE